MIQVDEIGPVRKFHLAQILLGRGRYFTACYWVDGVMVDTGCAHTVRELIHALEGLRVEVVLNTHSHEDHIAANAELQRLHGATVLAHPLALPVLAAPREKQPLRPYQRVMWGYPEPSLGSPLGKTAEHNDLRFQVIPTPGHSRDHVCFFETNHGWLFTGDAFIGGKDRALRADYDIWKIMASLRLIANLDPACIFSGSGSVKKDPKREILDKIAYLEDTADCVWDLHRKGQSYRMIRKKLFGPETTLFYITLGNFSGINLVRSFIEDRPQIP
ncbi:MAG: MBL fold metallo-hydrolase [Desulfatiglandaceae bacterium]|jgi:glyoxylase-like metal-dependent hydrolase (beta-lactamase superfamily II)